MEPVPVHSTPSSAQGDSIQESLAEMDRTLRALAQDVQLAPQTLHLAAEDQPAASAMPRSTARESQAARAILNDAASQLGVIQGEIDQILKLRDYLAQSIRGLLADCERGFAQIEAGLTPAHTFATPARVPISVPGPAAVIARSAVRLSAGPFRDLTRVETLEDALASVPAIEEVRLEGFQGPHANIELVVHGELDLATELEGKLPFEFRVTTAAPGLIELVVETPAQAPVAHA